MSRSLGAHDTTEYERCVRGQRRAFLYAVLPSCAGVIYGFAHWAGLL